MTHRLDPALDVDVTSEIELLSRSMIQGPWQLPVELARFALRHGATAVDVTRRATKLTVSARGGRPPFEALRRAAVAADAARPEGERHAAAVALEATGDLELLWALAARDVSVRATLSSSGRSLQGARDRRGGVRLEELPPSGPPVSIELVMSRSSARRAVDWIRAACRYAETPVRLDGDDLRTGIGVGSHRLRFDEPLKCVAHLGTTGDGPSLRLLRHGLLVTRATVPGFPSFVAAVELAGVAPEASSSADHRAAVTPFLPALVDVAVRGMLRLADELPRLDRDITTPIVRELLRAADLGLRTDHIRRAPLVEIVDARGRSSWRALDDLVGPPGPPPAVDPGGVERRPHTPVAVLDDASRRLAESVTGRRWPVAATTARHETLRMRMASVRAALVDRVRRVRFGRRTPVDVARLGHSGRRLHEVLERWVVPPDGGAPCLRWVEGARPPTARGSTLELGRDHPDIQRAMARLAASDAWQPVVARALTPDGWRIRDGDGDEPS